MTTLLLSALFIGTFASTPQAALAAPPSDQVLTFALSPQPVQSSSTPQLSVEGLISKVASEYSISSTTLFNLATSESRLKTDAVGDGGRAHGIMQIHYKLWGFTKEQVLDPEFSLKFAAKHIAAGTASKYWTPMNCYSYLKYALKLPLPKMAAIVPNAPASVGSVAVFRYSNGVKHVAYVSAISEGRITLKEANYEAGKVGTRTISANDPHLLGFWRWG